MKTKFLTLSLALILVAACESVPDTYSSVPRSPTPQSVANEIVRLTPEDRLTWGGKIVQVENLSDRTLIEVLAYPLDDGQGKPRLSQQPEGRFIVERRGFLEPMEYSAGKSLTARGRFLGFTRGKVGDSEYRYPVMSGEMLDLYQASPSYYYDGPDVHFGVGVSNHGSSVGVGIGF